MNLGGICGSSKQSLGEVKGLSKSQVCGGPISALKRGLARLHSFLDCVSGVDLIHLLSPCNELAA
jgi:hypothetical protein